MKNEKLEIHTELSQKHQAFVELQNHCPLCGNQLKIVVETYLADFTLREEATCETCDVLARVKDHRMH